MTCPQPIAADAAAPLTPPSAMARPMDTQAPRSTPAAITGQTRNDGIENAITSRCNKLRFPNGVQRGRYLALHRTLSQACLGDA